VFVQAYLAASIREDQVSLYVYMWSVGRE